MPAAAKDEAGRRMKDFLQADAPLRERSASTFMGVVALLVTPMALALIPVIGRPLAIALVSVFLPFAAYEGVIIYALRKGWYAPWVAWVNVAMETSIPLAILFVDLRSKGAVYALTAPPLVLWSALVMFSSLRARRSLAISAGALAAAEYLFVYFAFVRPELPADAPVTVQPAFMVIRAALLFFAGVGAAVVTHHLLRKAEEAMHAVRAQDLMSKYFLHEQLGKGGMAEVFRATYSPEGGFEKEVAVKRVLPSYSADPRFNQAFLREAQICSRLNHPNIVQVFDVGRFNGQYVLAMEFVDGMSLHALVRRVPDLLPYGAVAYIAIELAAALDYLHHRPGPDGAPLRLVHRDVNPANVLVSRIGEVKLADFGVAHAASGNRETTVSGKLGYLAPESARGDPTTPLADLYCLGVTLHEILRGERLNPWTTLEEALQMAQAPKPPIELARPDIPPVLAEIVNGLLASDPMKRPQSGAEVRDRLLAALPRSARPYPEGQQALSVAIIRATDRALPTTPSAARPGAVEVLDPVDVTHPSKPNDRPN